MSERSPQEEPDYTEETLKPSGLELGPTCQQKPSIAASRRKKSHSFDESSTPYESGKTRSLAITKES